VRSEGLYVNENSLTPAGIETATFRFVAQHLNHCATAVFYYNNKEIFYTSVETEEHKLMNGNYITALPRGNVDVSALIEKEKNISEPYRVPDHSYLEH